MAEAMANTSTDELSSIPYEVVRDKTLTTQDHLFKLIIIGDSGKSRATDRVRKQSGHL